MPDRWLRLEVELPQASQSPEHIYALAESLVDLGSTGLQEGEGSCVTYFRAPEDVDGFKRSTELLVRAAAGVEAGCTWSWQPHEAWAEVWRQGFTAHDFGSRLRVAPPWIELASSAGRATVLIDPGVAFGTAEHGSTRSCLTVLERDIQGGEAVLDVGAGSGVLAIAALKLGAASAVCVEIDEMACEALDDNAIKNSVAGSLSILAQPFGPDVAPGCYDLVVCNMVRSRLLPFLTILSQRVGSGGRLILGGIQANERGAILADLEILADDEMKRAGWSVPRVFEDTGWLAVYLRRLD